VIVTGRPVNQRFVAHLVENVLRPRPAGRPAEAG
jgi:hypothetical protein